MASGPITSWQIDGETVKTMTAEAPIFQWSIGVLQSAPSDAKNWLTGKDPDTGKDWRQEKGTTEDEMAGWHHQLNGQEFKQAPGVGDGQGSLACSSPCSQGYGFSSSHLLMWELECKESWVQNWCFWTVMLEKILESPLDCKEIQPVHPKGNQSWVFTGRTDVEAETPILWPPDSKDWLIWRDAGKDWGQEEKGMTEDEMVGWHHRLNGHGFG